MRIKQLQETQAVLERQWTDRLTKLQLKVIGLETHGSHQQQVAFLQNELQRMRNQNSVQYRAASATVRPTYLPPVTQTR